MEQDSEFTFDVARGDVGLSRHLRNSLESIKASAIADPDLRKRLDDVLAGRTSLREFGTSDEFAQALDRSSKQPLEQVASMSDQERTQLAEQAQADLERLAGDGGRPEPRADTMPPSGEPVDRAADPQGRQDVSPSASNVIPGTRRPNREQIFTPEEPDDDDLYYRDRRQRGWLT